MKRIIILLTLAIITVNLLYAGSNDGTATAVFLRMEQGVRALGMGGAFVAMDKDVECVWWNPAGASEMEGMQINAAYSDFVSDISGSYAAIAWPRGKNERGSLLANVNYISMGSVDSLDSSGDFVKSLSLSNIVASVGYAFPAAPGISVGVVVKNIQQNLGDYKASCFAADAGCLYKMSEILSLGVSAQNIGQKLKTSTVENNLPMNIRAGAVYVLSPKVLIACDGEMPNDADIRVHLGTEMKMSNSFSIRAGYNTSSAAGFSVGAGVLTPMALRSKKKDDSSTTWWKEAVDKDWSHNAVRIDYAYLSSGTLDVTHRLSLTLKF